MVGMAPSTEYSSTQDHHYLKELDERLFARSGTGLSRSSTGGSVAEGGNPFRQGSPFRRARTSASLAEEEDEVDPLA